MSLLDLFIIAVSLSMDAFAVSVCKGLSVRKLKLGHALTCGIYFGGFQALMPLLGYILGAQFAGIIESVSHWVACILMSIIGINMVKESLEKEEEHLDADFSPKAMLPLAVATSIDAFAVGVSFAAVRADIISAVSLIGIITCILSAIGVKIGNVFGTLYKHMAERLGGIVLILMGVKILLQGLGIL